jgi:nucleotide-binding universal stress UspA family protein
MNEQPSSEPSRIVLVVGVDLSEVSEHLLAKARDLVRSVDIAELHVVHVVRPEPLRERLAEPVLSPEGPGTKALRESAHWELERLCKSIVGDSGARWTIHVPVGPAADMLARVARLVKADVIVIEAHEHTWVHRAFHRSIVARVARTAPCSVLTLRAPRQTAATTAKNGVAIPAATPSANAM